MWGFGHPFENSGLRSLLLQDAYVYDIISNPNVGEDSGSTYKLAAAGHTLGTISNDASAAVVGRAGRAARDDPGARLHRGRGHGREVDARDARVVDETDVGTPTGSAPLTFVGPLALAQGASAILRSAPGKLSGTVCARIVLRERKRPLRFCNRYASAVAPSDPEAGENIVAAAGASDALTALSEIDDYKRKSLHVTEFSARVKLRRGLRQAFIRSVSMPRRVRRGQRVRVRLGLQVVRGPKITRSFRMRIPGSMRPGRRQVSFLGHDVDDPESDLFGALIETITIGGEDGDDGGGDPGARSLDALARRVRDVARYDGVTVRAAVGAARLPGRTCGSPGGVRRPCAFALPRTRDARLVGCGSRGAVGRPGGVALNPEGVVMKARNLALAAGAHPRRARRPCHRRMLFNGRISFSSFRTDPLSRTGEIFGLEQRSAATCGSSRRLPADNRPVQLGARRPRHRLPSPVARPATPTARSRAERSTEAPSRRCSMSRASSTPAPRGRRTARGSGSSLPPTWPAATPRATARSG